MKRATPFACPGCERKFMIYENYDEEQISIYAELENNPA
jgi:hypothetical protein